MAANRAQRLRDDAVIVRFGLMDPAHLRRAVDKCKAVRGFPGLSFFGENDLTAEEIAARAETPHGWLRTTTYGRLREAGYELVRDGVRNHLVLRFDGDPTDGELAQLEGMFDAPRRNPHPL